MGGGSASKDSHKKRPSANGLASSSAAPQLKVSVKLASGGGAGASLSVQTHKTPTLGKRTRPSLRIRFRVDRSRKRAFILDEDGQQIPRGPTGSGARGGGGHSSGGGRGHGGASSSSASASAAAAASRQSSSGAGPSRPKRPNDATPHAWRKGFVPLERATVEAGHPPLIFIPAAGGGPVGPSSPARGRRTETLRETTKAPLPKFAITAKTLKALGAGWKTVDPFAGDEDELYKWVSEPSLWWRSLIPDIDDRARRRFIQLHDTMLQARRAARLRPAPPSHSPPPAARPAPPPAAPSRPRPPPPAAADARSPRPAPLGRPPTRTASSCGATSRRSPTATSSRFTCRCRRRALTTRGRRATTWAAPRTTTTSGSPAAPRG